MLLRELDAPAGKTGVQVCTIDEALDYVRVVGRRVFLAA